MTSLLLGVFPLRNRLSKALPRVALAASALVGGASLLSGGQAKAFICSFGGAPMPPTACQTGMWYPSNPTSDKLVKFLNLPSKGTGSIKFDYDDNPPPGLSLLDLWEVDVDYNADLMPADGVSTFDYLIKIDKSVPHFPYFRDVSLGGGINGDASLTKEIWSTNGNGVKQTLLHTLIDDPFNSVNDLHYNLLPTHALDELYIFDTSNPGTIANGGLVNNHQNTFRQVPGPLPLLGAGAAFGYTRRLRRRLKATSLA
jgi:hypothetical protein